MAAETDVELEGFKRVHVKTLIPGDVVALKTLVKVGSGRGASAGPVQSGFAEFIVTEAERDGADRGWVFSAESVSSGSRTRRVCGETDHVYRRVS